MPKDAQPGRITPSRRLKNSAAIAFAISLSCACSPEWPDSASRDALSLTPLPISSADLGLRREEIRRSILGGADLIPLPSRTPVGLESRVVAQFDTHEVDAVAFQPIPGFFAIGNLYRPRTDVPHPVIIHFHGHFKNRGRFARTRDDVQQLSATLAAMGALVLTVDMVGWGESWQVTHGANGVLELQLWTAIRALDWLLEQPHVDPNKVGAVGASGGGSQTLLLSAVDDRITAAAIVVMLSAAYPGGDNCEIGMPVRRAAKTNNAEVAAVGIGPRPLLVVSDGTDWTRTTPHVELPYLQRAYEITRSERVLTGAHFEDEGHDLGPSKRRAVYEFFASTFGLRAVDAEAKSLPHEQLLFFNSENPRPADALTNAASVMAAIKNLQ